MTLIENCRHWWKLWSIRLNAIGLAVLTWVQFDPVGALAVWNMMPAPLREVLPRHFVIGIAAALFALSMLARVVVQPKLAKGNADADQSR